MALRTKCRYCGGRMTCPHCQSLDGCLEDETNTIRQDFERWLAAHRAELSSPLSVNDCWVAWRAGAKWRAGIETALGDYLDEM